LFRPLEKQTQGKASKTDRSQRDILKGWHFFLLLSAIFRAPPNDFMQTVSRFPHHFQSPS